MQFASEGNDPRLRALVAALDRDGSPAAETWRKVGDAAWSLGFPRPGYHLVRRLVAEERKASGARGPVRGVGLHAAIVLGASGRSADVGLRLGLRVERPQLVARQHKPP